MVETPIKKKISKKKALVRNFGAVLAVLVLLMLFFPELRTRRNIIGGLAGAVLGSVVVVYVGVPVFKRVY